MADRKAELEKKRKKLEELKKAREQKKTQSTDAKVKISGLACLDSLTQLENYVCMSMNLFLMHNVQLTCTYISDTACMVACTVEAL